jgi:hypothetical protein
MPRLVAEADRPAIEVQLFVENDGADVGAQDCAAWRLPRFENPEIRAVPAMLGLP